MQLVVGVLTCFSAAVTPSESSLEYLWLGIISSINKNIVAIRNINSRHASIFRLVFPVPVPVDDIFPIMVSVTDVQAENLCKERGGGNVLI